MDLIDTGGVSPDTLRELHADEARRLGKSLLWRAGAFVAALAFWASVDRHVGDVLFVLVGITGAVTAAAWHVWSKHRRTDPLAPSALTVEARQRAQKVVLAHQLLLHGRPAWFTYGVIGFIALVALLQIFVSGSIAQSVAIAGLVKPLVSGGEWWRLVSATYLHISVFHFWMNMAALLTCLATGFIGAFGFALIDNAAHAGGALTGALVAWLTVPRENAEPQPRRARLLDALGMVAAVLIVAGAAGTGLKLIHAGRGAAAVAGRPDVVVPLRSARAWIQTDASGTEAVIENLGERPIEAYTLTVSSLGVRQYQTWRDDCCFDNAKALGAAGIAPHERHVIALNHLIVPAGHTPPESLELTLVVFPDLSFEGSRNSRDEIFARRRAVAGDIDFWILVIAETLTLPVAEVEARLFARIDERAKAPESAHQVVSLFGIPSLARSATRSPRNYPAAAEHEKLPLMSMRAALLQRIPH